MPNCRLCENDGEEIPATRRIDETDLCAECADALEKAEERSKPVLQRLSKSEELLKKLDKVLDKAISGEMEPSQVTAVCKVSNSMLSLLQLQMRASKSEALNRL